MAARVHLGGIVAVVTARNGLALCSWTEGPAGAEHPRSAWFRFDLLSPVKDDGATLGTLLDAIAEAWSAPLTSLYWCNLGGWTVAITGRTATEQGAVTEATFTGDTRFDALLAAWEAAP